MLNIHPLVSVIISAYNADKLISETLESLLNQTYGEIEIIVVNDGSTDNTLEVANKYIKKGVKVITQENKGQDAALNNGYRHSTGDYIKFMDSDDLLNSEMIELQMSVLNGSEEYVAYSEWARFYNDNPDNAVFHKHTNWRDMAPIEFLTSEIIGPMLQCGTMLLPRKLVNEAGLWDERLILFNDTEFYTRVLLNSKGVKFSEGARLYYRSGQSNSISVQTKKSFFESTFLATCLIAENLISFEDSVRVRRVISNIFLSQYYRLYPFYKDLIKSHEIKIHYYGHGTLEPNGGLFFKLFNFFIGWKYTRLLQVSIYKFVNIPSIKNKFNRFIS